jgi:hypothetical protein
MRYYNLPTHRGGGLHSPLNMAVRGLVASDWIASLQDNAVWKPHHLSSLVSVTVLVCRLHVDGCFLGMFTAAAGTELARDFIKYLFTGWWGSLL